jgi:hypothetical protein
MLSAAMIDDMIEETLSPLKVPPIVTLIPACHIGMEVTQLE